MDDNVNTIKAMARPETKDVPSGRAENQICREKEEAEKKLAIGGAGDEKRTPSGVRRNRKGAAR